MQYPPGYQLTHIQVCMVVYSPPWFVRNLRRVCAYLGEGENVNFVPVNIV